MYHRRKLVITLRRERETNEETLLGLTITSLFKEIFIVVLTPILSITIYFL